MTQSPQPSFRPSRRAVARGAAWAVPAVVVASAAPAYAATGIVALQTSWALTSDADIAFAQVGDLVWTVQDSPLAAGSTVTLVIADPNSNLENFVWLEALNGLTGRALGSIPVPAGFSSTITLTTTAEVPVGSTFGLSIGPENVSTGSYSITWTVDPANPAGNDLTGAASWAAGAGFSQA